MSGYGHIEFSVDVATVDGAVLLTCRGELDVTTAPRLSVAIRRAVEKGTARLILDVSALEYMDSSGLTAVLNGREAAAEAGGRLAIACRPDARVRRLFTLTGLEAAIEIHGSADEALRALATRGGGTGTASTL